MFLPQETERNEQSLSNYKGTVSCYIALHHLILTTLFSYRKNLKLHKLPKYQKAKKKFSWESKLGHFSF